MPLTHIPINHPLRNVYRTLAGLAGFYIFIAGVLGVVRAWGEPFFGREDIWVLGLRVNMASALSSLLFGGVVTAAAIVGGRVEHLVNLVAGPVAMGTGFMMLVLLRHANFLNFSMTNVIVSFVFGLLFLTAGMYDKVGSRQDAEAEDGLRRGPLPMPHRVRPGGAG